MKVRRALVAASALAVAAPFWAVPTGPAAADPPITVEEAKAEVAQLQVDAEALDQQYLSVQVQLDAGRKKLKLKRADVAAKTAKVAQLRLQVGRVALAQFQNRTMDTTAQLFFTSDTDRFLNQISTVEKISENQNTVLQDFQAEQAELAELERSAASDVQSLQQQERDLSGLRAAADQKVAASKAVLARLTEEERRRLEAQERAAAAEARRAAEASVREAKASRKSSTRTKPRKEQSSSATSSGRGAKALAFARSQLGKPYQFGGDGPNGYDCSGLTSAAWATVGVRLPRTSQAQFGVGRAVSKSELQPGDLVFFYSGLSHVALYAGNGQILHSPRSGRSVEYMKMSYMPFAGARRPG